MEVTDAKHVVRRGDGKLFVTKTRRRREFATMLAALRVWQARGELPDGVGIRPVEGGLFVEVRPLTHIVSDDGTLIPLDDGTLIPLDVAEVNDLCERINSGDWPEAVGQVEGDERGDWPEPEPRWNQTTRDKGMCGRWLEAQGFTVCAKDLGHDDGEHEEGDAT